jgi:hypothetical protein
MCEALPPPRCPATFYLHFKYLLSRWGDHKPLMGARSRVPDTLATLPGSTSGRNRTLSSLLSGFDLCW